MILTLFFFFCCSTRACRFLHLSFLMFSCVVNFSITLSLSLKLKFGNDQLLSISILMNVFMIGIIRMYFRFLITSLEIFHIKNVSLRFPSIWNYFCTSKKLPQFKILWRNYSSFNIISTKRKVKLLFINIIHVH